MAFGDVISTAKDNNATNTATLTIAPVSGNLLIAMMSVRAPVGQTCVSFSATAGWNAITDQIGTQLGAGWFYKIADGSETSVVLTVTPSSGTASSRGAFVEIEGPFDASPLDQTAEDAVGAAVTSKTSGTTGTTAQADELAAAFFYAESAGNVDGGRAYTNSFTEAIFADGTTNAGRPLCALAKRVLSATGTFETTYSTTDPGDNMYGAIATFKKSGGGGGATLLPRLSLLGVG